MNLVTAHTCYIPGTFTARSIGELQFPGWDFTSSQQIFVIVVLFVMQSLCLLVQQLLSLPTSL